MHDIFEEQTSLNRVVHKIMRRALTMLKCERCSVLLLSHPVLGNSRAEDRASVSTHIPFGYPGFIRGKLPIEMLLQLSYP